jgi:hypothetical protein
MTSLRLRSIDSWLTKNASNLCIRLISAGRPIDSPLRFMTTQLFGLTNQLVLQPNNSKFRKTISAIVVC